MISYDDIRQLQQYKSGPDSLIVSLYVDIDQSNAANLNRGFETAVENLFRQMAERNSIDESKKQRFEAEWQRILRFLNGYTPRGKGLVVFSDSKQDFWWQRDLQVQVPTELRWSPNPWVRPLLEVLEEHDRIAVVLIDKQHARIFTVDAIGIEQQSEIISDVPNKHATTGTDHIWSQTHMDRDHAKHIKWHARRVAEEVAAITDRLKISKLIVGGPVEATSIFMGDLPKRLEQMIIGTISVPVDASYDRLLTEVRAVQEKAEHEDEARLVESMVTSAHKGDRAVLGIADTLAALEQGRIYCMVVAKDYRVEGKQCSSCRVLAVDGTDRCSFCGGRMDPAPDLINRASHKVIEQAGKVYMVSGAAAEKLGGQGIGAMLRF